jgi:hypothetical protein
MGFQREMLQIFKISSFLMLFFRTATTLFIQMVLAFLLEHIMLFSDPPPAKESRLQKIYLPESGLVHSKLLTAGTPCNLSPHLRAA